MDIRIQIIIAAITIVTLIVIVMLIKQNKLELKYALSWIFLSVSILVLDIWPNLIIMISRFMGIDYPINMLFFLGFCFSLLIIFTLTIALSRMSKRVKTLTQELALTNKKIDEINKHE